MTFSAAVFDSQRASPNEIPNILRRIPGTFYVLLHMRQDTELHSTEWRYGLPQVILPARYLDSKGTLCTGAAQNGARRITIDHLLVSGVATFVGLIATFHSFI
ncbi:uncharacterized protein BT62DRAFT_1012899 [Guyanagaster necrorhizus]|uniref:Uncharacterized protein n=1 Tax=Guyanagaster necrorhizus TaxID=856835 RepID=A0A9P7VGQ3_9AGAR|nr:uncharacterized protein BT62DRAFT_1012899 [Guyanagaster necrorhizus MCA 3950]KAG7440247.1 hypothetical protein BT62DRAFT_1012899 [Guyanagaster necrorhizus MCA 3950]